MAKQTQTTDQKIINSGAMQYLMRFPAEGRVLRVMRTEAGLAASIADELGKANDAIPFSLALRALQVQPAEARAKVLTIWSGPLKYEMPFPVQEGRLMRIRDEGGVVAVSMEDEPGRPQDAYPFTHAFRSLQGEPVLATSDPFAPYHQGFFCRLPEAVDTEENDVQHATL